MSRLTRKLRLPISANDSAPVLNLDGGSNVRGNSEFTALEFRYFIDCQRTHRMLTSLARERTISQACTAAAGSLTSPESQNSASNHAALYMAEAPVDSTEEWKSVSRSLLLCTLPAYQRIPLMRLS